MGSDRQGMFLRKRPKTTGTDDISSPLRESLAMLLHAQVSSVPASLGQRMQTLAERLESGHVPRGLLREISELAKAIRPVDDGDDVVDISQAFRALADALVVVAMDDRELRVLIHHFSGWLPRRISAAHARRISARVTPIAEAAPAAWDRISDAQQATASLVKNLVSSIAKASGGSHGLTGNLDALAVTVVQLKDVKGMADLSARMESQMDGMRLQIALMERELMAARAAAVRIQAAVDPEHAEPKTEQKLRDHLRNKAG